MIVMIIAVVLVMVRIFTLDSVLSLAHGLSFCMALLHLVALLHRLVPALILPDLVAHLIPDRLTNLIVLGFTKRRDLFFPNNITLHMNVLLLFSRSFLLLFVVVKDRNGDR